jgi:rRNA maturation RNase YbeY
VAADAIAVEIDHPSRRIDPARVKQAVAQVLDGEDRALRGLTVVLSDHDTVHRLNREYLGHDYVTDVLSFDLSAPDDVDVPDAASSGSTAIDGEVYVDLDTAAERHDEFGASFEEEVLRYVIHGVLHLAGYDDATEAAQEEMRVLEDRYLHALAAE